MYTCFIINLYFNYNIYIPQLYEALQKLQKNQLLARFGLISLLLCLPIINNSRLLVHYQKTVIFINHLSI